MLLMLLTETGLATAHAVWLCAGIRLKLMQTVRSALPAGPEFLYKLAPSPPLMGLFSAPSLSFLLYKVAQWLPLHVVVARIIYFLTCVCARARLFMKARAMCVEA